MDSSEDRQQLEITALKSIYDEDFIECPPPRAWKGATRLPEFIIRIRHPDESHSNKIYFNLHTKFPKTYPTLTYPIFTIQQPIFGLKPHDVTKLSNAIHAEAQSLKGNELVFQIITFAQDWLLTNVKPPAEVPGSLALQMTQRAHAEEEAKRQRERVEREEAQERATQRAEELQAELRVDAARQQVERERRLKARKRAMSDATEVPPLFDELAEITPTEIFTQVIEWDGVKFSAAEPIIEGVEIPFHLELLSRKKLKQVETELERLLQIRHNNIVVVLAVKLVMPHSSGPPRLVILTEARPSPTLQDVLDDCDYLREDRATDYIGQILSALNAIHTGDLVHRGLIPKWIGLAPPRLLGDSKQVKVFNVTYYVRLLDMHRSDPFGPNLSRYGDESQIPEGWQSKDVIESPLVYNRCRDLHSAGIVLIQMLLGRNVTSRYHDVHTALSGASISPTLRGMIFNMLFPVRKNAVTAFSLLAELRGATSSNGSRSPVISIAGPKTPVLPAFVGSPESDYFRAPPPKQSQSRWKSDWEELELLGKGAFGSVVKARNKIDERDYAVKKIKLRAAQNDSKIFREVNALSRLNHRFIVRYYTTWFEESSPTAPSSVASESGTSIPGSREPSVVDDSDPLRFNLDELDSGSKHSFPSIRFTHSGSPESSSDDAESDEVLSDDPFAPIIPKLQIAARMSPHPAPSRTLYIQMEFVERQTLKERIAEGLSEEDAWRLFQQIVDALVHMASLGILHRDIKLTNIFIDGKGDCKVGDFGLATSSLAAVDPSDLSLHVSTDTDMTLDVGTRLYIAPEVQSSKGGFRSHAKADLYSLGIVFFEMNHAFSTGAERIAVLEGLRRPDIIFPSTWEPRRERQRQIITWLLQHDPNARPTALELAQSPLVPARVEDDSLRNALKTMFNPESPHFQAVLSTLFCQNWKPSRGLLYDNDLEQADHATLLDIVHDRMVDIFRRHGAVHIEPALLMPSTNPEEEQQSKAIFIDRHGDPVALPNNAIAPFARLAARADTRRIKRYHIGDCFRPALLAGHPKPMKVAIFDIITPDVVNGHCVSAAEAIAVVNSCMETFANLEYEVRVSHSKILDVAFSRIPNELQSEVAKVLDQTKVSQSQKRAILLRKGVPRNIVDELEVLMDVDADVDSIIGKLERVSPQLLALIGDAIEDVRMTLQFTVASGVGNPVYFHPLFMISNPNPYFKNGILFEVVRRNKRSDILALGGRYDHIISRYASAKPKSDAVCAFAVQISLEKISMALASFQSVSQKTILKERKSYGYWSPRRCDVYVVSQQEGYLIDRLELTSMLWKNGISADLMYEFGLKDAEHENVVDQCSREGILFIVYPRPRIARKDQLAFKVKSVLKGTEHEGAKTFLVCRLVAHIFVLVARHELVSFLHQQIAEQKRIDASFSGVPLIEEGSSSLAAPKDVANPVDVQLVLPGDAKKQRKQTKQILLDKAFEFGVNLKKAFLHGGVPVIAVDVPPVTFEQLTKNCNWVTDDDAWKPILATFPTQHTQYALQLRDAVAKRKEDGLEFAMLFAVREEKPSLLVLN
ncbi:hypothetical protein NLI96_g7338 [Meripilus lineatus]|uniref:non-specific serine/threonine protein kinase n=1 Tax=Meripilus lineatus TaxID=2056292 RepID=A0AAD5YC63_9APHY|nr:hypothetical protein NLI96_g7338 [Physisporinus lineatus]